MKGQGMPSCFSDETEYVIWMKYDSVSHMNGHRSNGFVCKDCSKTFQTAMLAEGRCEHPEVVFGPVPLKLHGVTEYEYAGYIPIGPKAKLTNGYLPNATKPEMAKGSGVCPDRDCREAESDAVRVRENA